MVARRLVASIVLVLGLGLGSVAHAATPASDPSSSAAPAAKLRPQGGPFVGTIYIARGSFVYIRSNVYSGVDNGTLNLGVGYWPGTGRPGYLGNPTFAGHRTRGTAPFNLLVNVQVGDKVTVFYGGSKYDYVVFKHFDVKPTDVWIKNGLSYSIFGTRLPTLTLFTCNQGSQKRHAVFAYKINNGPPKIKVPLPKPPTPGGTTKPPMPSW